MSFSHMWLIAVSDSSGFHAIGMNVFEETKSQNFFQDQHPHGNVESEGRREMVSDLLLEKCVEQVPDFC